MLLYNVVHATVSIDGIIIIIIIIIISIRTKSTNTEKQLTQKYRLLLSAEKELSAKKKNKEN